MGELTKDEIKDALKEAHKEWMSENFAAFGRWTFYGLMVLGMSGVVFLFLSSQGWHKG